MYDKMSEIFSLVQNVFITVTFLEYNEQIWVLTQSTSRRNKK